MMKALIYDDKLLIKEIPKPERQKNQSLIKVILAGICNTDLEILKGYMAFKGVLGHEFVGIVEESDSPSLIGKKSKSVKLTLPVRFVIIVEKVYNDIVLHGLLLVLPATRVPLQSILFYRMITFILLMMLLLIMRRFLPNPWLPLWKF